LKALRPKDGQEVDNNRVGSFYSQELVKKKEEVDRLNKEMNSMIEDSHQKYLSYESQIVELEIK
jgi:hypothetical protein